MRSTIIIVVYGLLALVAMTVNPGLSPRSALAAGVSDVDAGGRHTCALVEHPVEHYGVKCWGDNIFGQLGDGRNVDQLGPVDTCASDANAPCRTGPLLWGITAVSAGGIAEEREGGHTCALTVAGGVKCWGLNEQGQLGDGTNLNRSAPVDVEGLTSGVAAITTGGFHTCAVTAAGGVKCWGLNDEGQLGDGTNANSNVPVEVCGNDACSVSLSNASVPGEFSLRALDAGARHSCVLTSAGGILCWGDNSSGQLGHGNDCGQIECRTPTGVAGIDSGAITLAAGAEHTCARVDGDALKCWGLNDGQLGSFEVELPFLTTPADVCADSGDCLPLHGPFLSGVSSVTAGDWHTCVTTTTAGSKCWGRGEKGQVGDGAMFQRSRPEDVCAPAGCPGLLSNVTAVSGGGEHTCAATAGGSLFCWGWNAYGQLGVGSRTNSPLPLEVLGAKDPFFGDVDCDGLITSIDAALVLQFDAGLIDELDCLHNADVNGDGNIDSVDALLILQHVAGLIDRWPPLSS